MILAGTKQIPDVSFYQEPIDWDVMRSKTDAVIIRAGQNLWIDPSFIKNYTEAKKRGMKRGVYWFFDDRISPSSQATLLLSLIRNDLPEMEVWCDWEKWYGGSYKNLSYPVAFMQMIEKELPVSVGFYTGYYWMRDHSDAINNSAEYAYLKTKPLWLANYNPVNLVLVPAPWASVTGQPLLWQYGTPSLNYGQSTIEIDMSIVNLTDDDFYRRYGGAIPPTGEAMSIYNIKNNSTTSTRTIRQGPGVVFASVDNLPVNGTATGDFCYTYTATNTTLQASAGDKWIQIGANRWLAWIHKGVTYLTVDIAPAPAIDLSKLNVVASVALDIEGEKRVLTGPMSKV